jgi:hypothetical protein
MAQLRTTRILVVTDHADPSGALLDAITHRAETGDVQFRIVVPNPARAELHLLHPERHDKARRQRWCCARHCRSSSTLRVAP